MRVEIHEPLAPFIIPPAGAVSANTSGKRAPKALPKAARRPPKKKAVGKVAARGSQERTQLTAGELEVTFVPVTHPVESMAMIVRSAAGAILYTSDTGPTTKLWQVANETADLRGMFVELSFPNHMQALADVAGHFTPQTLCAEMDKVRRRSEIPLFVYHLKPAFYELTKNELMALGMTNMHLVELTDEFVF
jgi:ribonuclease BN (tRNA processing enzyme)